MCAYKHLSVGTERHAWIWFLSCIIISDREKRFRLNKLSMALSCWWSQFVSSGKILSCYYPGINIDQINSLPTVSIPQYVWRVRAYDTYRTIAEHTSITRSDKELLWNCIFSSMLTKKCAHVVISKLIDFFQGKNRIQHHWRILYTFVYKHKTMFTG